MKYFSSPWGMSLVLVSALSTILLGGLAVFSAGSDTPLVVLAVSLPVLLLAGCALFTIRGYVIAGDTLLIRRLLWNTRVPLAGLLSAQADPCAMRSSLRLCGNGGLYSISGWYRNKTLGTYRAFVTDSRNTVVLRFAKRTVVVSPGDPDDFVHALAGIRDRC